MMKPAHVIFASDDRGVNPLCVALCSLLSTHDFTRPLTVSVLNGGGDFSERSRSMLEAVAARHPRARFEIIGIDPFLERHRAAFERSSAWPLVAWGRCMIAEIFPEENGSVVYFDIDTLVAHDLSELYELDFARTDGGVDMLAAVYDDERSPGRTDPPWGNGVMPVGSDRYFNSGVIVFNAKAFREEDGLGALARWYAVWKEKASCPDQDALNAVFWNRVRRLPVKFNYCDGWLERQRKCDIHAGSWRGSLPREILEATLDPFVLHYWGSHKPWRWNHRPEGLRYENEMRRAGVLTGALPGTTPLRRLSSLFFRGYHALLRRQVARRLREVCYNTGK